jgi:hypothetical protein
MSDRMYCALCMPHESDSTCPPSRVRYRMLTSIHVHLNQTPWHVHLLGSDIMMHTKSTLKSDSTICPSLGVRHHDICTPNIHMSQTPHVHVQESDIEMYIILTETPQFVHFSILTSYSSPQLHMSQTPEYVATLRSRPSQRTPHVRPFSGVRHHYLSLCGSSETYKICILVTV